MERIDQDAPKPGDYVVFFSENFGELLSSSGDGRILVPGVEYVQLNEEEVPVEMVYNPDKTKLLYPKRSGDSFSFFFSELGIMKDSITSH